ncbi:MAG TPA: hypothetical protein DCG28_05865 [Lachnospiraceae bacterium]|nr:hypothetical protein [Lachnospiraceae bacterium]
MKKAIFPVYVTCFTMMFISNAYAYIDPATTSYVIQIGAGVVIALGTVIGIYWKKIQGFFKKKNEDQTVEPSQSFNPEASGDVVTADDLLKDEK